MKSDLQVLYKKPGHLVRRAHQTVVAAFMEETAPFDVTPVQYAAMVAIKSCGRTDATRISSLIAFDRATLGKVLERLERKGLVSREFGVEDKRTKIISLTDAGKKLIEEVEPAVKKSQSDFLAPLTKKEAADLLRLLEKAVRLNKGARGKK